MKNSIPYIAILMLALTACGEKLTTPKPRAYPRVEFPERSYTQLDRADCPFTFTYPSYAEVKDKSENKPCWFDLYMPAFNARLHCSYIEMKSEEEYGDLIKDAFVIAAKINERANFMQESRIRNEQGVGGLLLTWTGPAASPVHFFLTDTTQHFFKAALYFDSKAQPDSLAPITEFIRKDLDNLISSFKWKN